jgi:N-acetylmuramoyl-L-alanine amidase
VPFARIFIAILLALGVASWAEAASLNELRAPELSERGLAADLLLKFRKHPKYKIVQSGQQSLYVVDFPGALFRPTRKRIRPRTRLAKYMVVSQYDRRTVRLVVKRDPAARIRVVREGKSIRVEVRHPATGFRPGDVPVLAKASAGPKKSKVTAPLPQLFTCRQPSDKPRIVIDPGHGGRDPGAVGKHTTDKAIALAVALRLKKVFEKDKQVQVFFTRTEDRFVPLEDRAALAQRVGADVFISLHANSGPPSARGFEVWYLSSKGSRREAHRLLRGGRKSASVDLIQRIIVDKQREGTQNKSSLLAGFLNQSLSTTGQKSRGARAENFAVLRSVAVPSILIELGFLSDKREEARLMTAKFQTQQAEAIRDGVLAYLRSQGLLGSEMPARTLYAVRKNDSLSEISQRFGIELVDLAMANGLGKASPLYVGQLLEIPNDPVGALIGAHIE